MASLKDITLFGDRILVQLDQVTDTVTEHGIIVPLFENYETDGGKPSSKISSKKYSSVGTVLKISNNSPLQLAEGTKVYVNPSSSNQQFQFYLDRTKLVQDFEGLICIPHTLIEATITTNGN